MAFTGFDDDEEGNVAPAKPKQIVQPKVGPGMFDDDEDPAASPAPVVTATATHDSVSEEGFRAVVGGIRDAAQGVVDTLTSLPDPVNLAERGVRALTGTSVPAGQEFTARPDQEAAIERGRKMLTLPDVEENVTTVGAVSRELVKWVVGTVALRAIPGVPKLPAGASLKLKVAEQVAEGVVTGYVFTDPDAHNLGNLIESVPVLGGPISDFLGQDPDSPDAINKLRGSLENMIVGPLVAPLMHYIPALVKHVKLKNAGRLEEAAEVLAEADPKLAEIASVMKNEPFQLGLYDMPAAAVADDVAASGLASDAAASGLTGAPRIVLKNVVDSDALIQDLKVVRSAGQDGAALELAGTLNYSKLGDDNAVKQMISTVVQHVAKDLPDVMGSVQTKAETIELAKYLGKSPVDLTLSLAATAEATENLAARLVGGKMLIQRIAKELDSDASMVISGKAELIDLAGFQVKADLLANVIDNVAGMRTEAARATAAGRYKTGMGGITSANVNKILEAAGGADYVRAMAQRLKMAGLDKVPSSLTPAKSTFEKAVGIHNYIWMNSILSGIKTTMVNVGSTAFNAGLMPAYRMIGGVAMELAGKSGSDEFYKGLRQYQSMRGVFMDSFTMAAKAWRTNGSVLDMTASPLELAQRLDPISELAAGKAGVEWLGWLVGMPGRFLSTQDEFFKQITYRSHVSADAWVEGAKQGLDGQALSQYIAEALQKSVDEWGKGLNDSALMAARNATFTQSLTQASYFSERTLMAGISDISGQHPLVKGFILPFVRVPTNLFRQFVDMTPGLNLIHKQWMDDVKAGGELAAHALGKLGVGTALWSAAGYLAYEGRITGGGPKDADLRRQLGPDWKPYSLVTYNEDGTKNFTSFARFDPFSHFFAIAGDLAEIAGKIPDEEFADLAGRAGLAVMQNITSKTYLRSLSDAIEAFSGDEAAARYWVRSRVASYVPNIVQVLQTDDEVKDLRGYLDGFIARVPGWSHTIPAKRDNFGEKITQPMSYPFNALNPFTHYRGTDDPVRLELVGLTKTKDEPKFTLPSFKQGPVDLREIKNPETGQSAYDRWLELHSEHRVGGKTLHESMAQLFASPSYQAARARMGEGDAGYKGQALAIEWVRQRFEMYQDLTLIQLKREFKDMGMDIGKAITAYEIGKNTTRARGSNTATPIDQLQKLAGQE